MNQIIEAKRRWMVSAANLTYRMHKLGLLSDWQYRVLFMEIGRKGYRTHEPNGAQGETSQVLAKVFKALREDGMTMGQVARKLNILPDELSKAVFGLVLTPVMGGGITDKNTPQQEGPRLRLV